MRRPRQIGEHDRIAPAGKLEHAAVVIFADLRPLCLDENHAEQVVRLRNGRRDTHGVAGVDLGFAEIALVEQQQRELVGGPEIIGVEGDDVPDQRFGRRRAVLVFADLVEHAQRARPVRRQLQHLQAKLLGGVDRTLAMGLRRAFHQRHQVPAGFRRGAR